MPFLLKLLGGVNWKRVVAITGIGGLIALLCFVRLQGIALKRMELAYKNPQVIDRTRTVRVEGPVRIVTRTITTPGRTEVVREEVHDPVVTTHETAHSTTPVFPPQLDRYLLGINWMTTNPNKDSISREYGVHFGKSLENRLDITVGFTNKRRAMAGITFRFGS